jgi:hypothetical protein
MTSASAIPGTPLLAASMNYDHRAIRRWIDTLESADIADVAKMQELLYGLDALIRVHIWKENELYLTPLESASWPASAEESLPSPQFVAVDAPGLAASTGRCRGFCSCQEFAADAATGRAT